MGITKPFFLFFSFFQLSLFSWSQTKGNDVNTPLHNLQPTYPVPYIVPSSESIKEILDRVRIYLTEVTSPQLVNQKNGDLVAGLKTVDTNVVLNPMDFRLTSYEWGVTYSGMLNAGEATGDSNFTNYTRERLRFIADAIPAFMALYKKYPKSNNPFRQPIAPRALDDAGAMCAAMIKTFRMGGAFYLRPVIDNYINYISTKQFRLTDGTLARNIPFKHTLWLDDLYMSVPALAQAGKLTGDQRYYDDAVKQVLQFSNRMFNKEKGIYMHGWVQEMKEHPEFHWARANGWALMAMVELLDVLPDNHPGKEAVIKQLQAHIKGLAAYQSDKGLWHQLLDRNDSYLETSATAIYTFCIARAINKGWVDAITYGPMCLLAWNAITTKVNAKGQVEGTCVGTGMAFDPAFYYCRPINVYAAHGYGPVLLAGGEVIKLLRKFSFKIHDNAITLKQTSS
jgi:rhamnogalacturonyl hydrolase YesR